MLVAAIRWAFVTGIFTAAYTTWDAYGIRAAADPFTFLAWFFALDGILFPLVALGTGRAVIERPEIGALVRRGIVGGLVAYASFGSVMMATRIDKVGQAAVLRETSVVFAAIIGVVFLHERVSPLRAGLVLLIALGAVVVEFGG